MIDLDGQEIILYYHSGKFERLNNLYPHSVNPSKINSLSNQANKLAFLTTTITNLQSNACLLQRTLNKIQIFYQLNLKKCLKLSQNQWKLILHEQELRIFQPNDFLLILLCHCSSNDIKIYQLISKTNWIFEMTDLISTTFICQPILILRNQNQIHCQLGWKQMILPFQVQIQEDPISFENYFPNKFKSLKHNHLSIQQYRLVLTIQNEAAWNFKSKSHKSYPIQLIVLKLSFEN